MYITASDRHYPQKTAVILNPHSGRLRKRMASLRQVAAGLPRALVHEPASTTELGGIMDECAAAGVDHLVIAGGDGTVQAAITHLLNNSHRWAVLPALGIIPGGTTNMTAADIGSTGNPMRCLERLIRTVGDSARLQLLTRPALQIEQSGQPNVYGMFFGAGLISRGSDLFHRRIKKTGATGESLSAIVILPVLAGLLAGHKDGLWSPVEIGLHDDGGIEQNAGSIMMFASTLDRLLLGMRPYWGAGSGPVHTTWIRESPRNLCRSLVKILSGRGDRLLSADGYYSRNNEWLELMMDGDYIVDGEFFTSARSNGPLRISATPPLRFLLP